MARLIRRGDFIIAALPGEYGKPRPALAVQSDLFSALPSVTLCPLTSFLRDDADLLRITVEPAPANGIRQVSQIVIDKITTLSPARIRDVIGHADDVLMMRVNHALALFLGIV